MANELFRKDKIVQVYKTITRKKEGTTTKVNYRQFVYNKYVYDNGGLLCYIRDMTDTETTASGLAIAKDNIKVRFNYNEKIDENCKIIFKGKVYNIQGNPDKFDYNYRGDIVVTATAVEDSLQYEGDLYLEE